MGKGRKAILVSGFILAFVAGTMISGPQAIAANPVLEQVLAIVTGTQTDVSSIKQQIEDSDSGLVEIKNEVRNIETKVTNIENILENEPPPTSCEDLGFTDCF